MELKEFVELVKKMREMQKEYFRTRSMNVLNQSKALERQVDNAIKTITETDNQLKLSYE